MNRLLTSLAFVICAASLAQAQYFHLTERNLLAGQFDSLDVTERLVAYGDWRPYPTIDDREDWLALPVAVRNAHIAEGDSLLGTTWAPLPATTILEFVRTGNRSNLQGIRNVKRTALAKLVLAEVFEDKGRFLDDILNGIWSISEETYWGVPAHLDLQTSGYGLPDVDEPTVDLFAAETGSLFAWTLYLLGDRLDSVSPLVRPRMLSELRRRIINPNLERSDFWWMGFNPSVINNWTPWVASNWLTVVLIAEADAKRRASSVYKIMRSVDVFINSYPEDGGCDEGPTYWTRAGGSLLEVLELLRSATGGLVDIYDEPLIREMGRYIVKGHVAGDYFVNFADASPRLTPPAAVVHRYGLRLDDESMMDFAGYFAEREELGRGYVPGRFGHLNRQLMTLFALENLSQRDGSAPLYQDVWLEDTQFMTARSEAGTPRGLFLAAKGGHNEENHNHNDVGSFIIYVDGEPAIIDVGPGTYTRTTFSEDRYSVWNFQSAYHNVPTINGEMQPFGSRYRARAVKYAVNDQLSMLEMDLAGAYPPGAGVSRWTRSLALERTAGLEDRVRLIEDFELDHRNGQTELNFMTTWSIEPGVGAVKLSQAGYDTAALWISYDASMFEVAIDEVDMEDARLQQNWGKQMRRLRFVLTDSAGNEAQAEFSFSSRGSE